MSHFYSINPATETVVFEHQTSSFDHVDHCVQMAYEVFQSWSMRLYEDRKAIVCRFGQLVREHFESLVLCVSKETGKPLWESRLEVQAMIHKVDISIESFETRCKQESFQLKEKTYHLKYKPLGVMAVLGPFNFPMHLPQGHIIPALLAGNCVVFKPSEYTSQSAKLCVDLWIQAGLPQYVLSLVLGDGVVGELLYQHALIQGVLFTGGYNTGQKISAYCGAYPEKLLALELGGNNPLVIHTTQLSDSVFDIIKQSAFLTAGQRCTAANRLIVSCPKNVFEARLVKAVSGIKIGAFTDKDAPFMGPVIHQEVRDRLLTYHDQLVSQGARSVIPLRTCFDVGYFLSPGVLDVTDSHQMNDSECFGPLLHLIYVSSLEEAIHVANQTRYGLSASLVSDNTADFELFFNQVKAGIINFNGPTNGASSKLPFGGIGYSGNYRPSAYFAADYCSYPVASTMVDFL